MKTTLKTSGIVILVSAFGLGCAAESDPPPNVADEPADVTPVAEPAAAASVAEPEPVAALEPAEPCPLFDTTTLDRLAVDAGAPASGSVANEYTNETDYTTFSGTHADHFTRFRTYVSPGTFFVDVIEGGERSDGSKYNVVSVSCASNGLELTPCPSLAELQDHPRSKGTMLTIASIFPITSGEAAACRSEIEGSRLFQ